MRCRHIWSVPTVAAWVLVLWPAAAGATAQDATLGGAVGPGADIVPPPPAPPAVMARDEAGRTTIRAVRIEEPLRIDGVLDEDAYSRIPSITGFTQQEPHEGMPSTERAEVWVLFDDNRLYVSARLWQDPAEIVATEMRRDHMNLSRNDNFAVIFDTFRDRRSGFFFHISAAGGMLDGLVTDESRNNREWNTVWWARTGRFSGGWTVEIAIPFRSLRYGPGRDQVWGINFRRILLARNERATFMPVPASYGNLGVARVSLGATLVGIQVPPGGMGLELKPYAISTLTTDRSAAPAISNHLGGDAGVDLKYAPTPNLTLDFTYNTDFAQVEDDEQQVNLTRFSLFFPERREFFLEGQGLFSFGGTQTSGRIGGTSNTPVLFFSRRIGLSSGRPLPVHAGARLTGRVGGYSIGALNIQTGADDRIGAAATNFSVVRLRRDVLQRSAIGLIATHRSPFTSGPGSNQALGVDAMLSPHRELRLDGYYAVTQTPGRSGDNASYRVQLNYPADRYGVLLEHLTVEPNFNPEVGFLRRQSFRRNFAQMRFSPRPQAIETIRKLSWEGSLDYITDASGRLESRETQLSFQADFENGDLVSADYTQAFERLADPFEIATAVVLPPGDYRFGGVQAQYQFGPQRFVPGSVTLRRGGFFSGSRTEAGYEGRLDVGSILTLEPNVSMNWIDLPEGRFTTRLMRVRSSLTFSPQTLLGALVQYNASDASVALNVRFRWEYRPLSELFVVYSEGRDALSSGFRELQNRSLAVKLTRLVRF